MKYAEDKTVDLYQGYANNVMWIESSDSVAINQVLYSIEKLVELMAINPRKRFGIKQSADDVTVFDLSREYTVNPDEFYTMGKSTPFAGEKLHGTCMATFRDGKLLWRKK